jgi:rhodanese-related sulfurtransferase
MSQYLEFIANHPILSAAAIALVAIIIAYEVRRATRGYAEVEAGDATRLMNHDDALLIDVRGKDAFDKRHILHAINVPAADLGEEVERLRKHAERPVIVYCDSGLTSGRSAAALRTAGFSRVYDLKGGLSAWETAGLPVKKGRK